MAKFLRVKTDSKLVIYEDIKPQYEFSGGRNLIANILNNEIDPKCDPLGPENKLIVCAGLLGDTTAPSCGRLSIGGKSPLTGGIKESNSGGVVGKMLGRAGLMAIIIENQPANEEWFILKVGKNQAELIQADQYIGLDNYDLTKKLHEEYGNKIGIVSIGGAGEKGYLNSSIQITDSAGNPSRAAARGGLGAVMGSKGIKAIVFDVTGPSDTQYADKEKFKTGAKSYLADIKANPLSGQFFPALGTAGLVNMCNAMGILPTNNFSNGRWEKAENVSGEKLVELQSARGGKIGHVCTPGCVIGCSNIYHDENGQYLTSGLEYETICLAGPNCGISSLDTIAKIDRLCDDFGLDTMETACTIGVCMEAGIIPFGDGEKAIKLIQEIINGTEFGKILGKGTEFTGKKLGIKRIPTVKGQSLAGYDPRGLKGVGVGMATSAMGADHTTCQTLGAPGIDPCSKEGQIELSKMMQALYATVDSIGMCMFAAGPLADQASVEHVCEMMAGKFGGEWNMGKLFNIGAQTLLLERDFNRKAGFTAKDDKLPDFMYSEILPSTNTVFDITEEELEAAF